MLFKSKKLAIVVLAVLALALAACGGEVTGRPEGTFSLKADTLVMQPGSTFEITEPSFLDSGTGSRLDLEPGAVIEATSVLTITLSTGEAEGEFEITYPPTTTVSVEPTDVPTTSVAAITIDGNRIEVPNLVGPFTDAEHPGLWTDAGAEILVEGVVVGQADDELWWHNGDGSWVQLTADVDSYSVIPEGGGFLRVVDNGGDTYVNLMETMPAPASVPTPAPPTVASIQIEGYDLLEVPHMVGPFESDVYPEFWTEEGASVEMFGKVAAQADDQIWYQSDGSSDWVQLTVNVAAYCFLPEGKGRLKVIDLGGNSYIKFLEAIPPNP